MTEVSIASGRVLLNALKFSGLGEREYWREHLQDKMTYSSFHGRIWRAKQGIIEAPHLFDNSLGTPFHVSGDFVITGDWQLPTTDYQFAAMPMVVGKKHLRSKQRKLIIAGDFINADAFSDYESDVPTPAFEREVAAASAMMEEILTVFDEVYWIWGNHERRVGRKTKGALTPHMLRSLVTPHAKRVHVSHWGHMLVDTPLGTYRVTHGRAYSVQQLNVADMLAQKYQQHIISHHEHHASKGWDRYKRYVIVNNGGVFNQSQMGYAVLDDDKNPNMQVGFTLLKDGCAELLSAAPYTNWNRWL